MSGQRNPGPIQSKTSHKRNSGNQNREITVASGYAGDFVCISVRDLDGQKKDHFHNISRKAAKRLAKTLRLVLETQ